MEFTIKKSEILREVNLTQGVVEKKTTIPILANLLIDASGDFVRLVATDLDVSLKCLCPANVKREGSITTPARNFLDIIRSLPEADVKIKKLDNNWVQITCAAASFKIIGLPPDNFPAVPELNDSMAEIQAKVLLNLINKTIFAIASEESRYTINGALLLIKPLSVTMVATDGHRLAHVERTSNFEHLNAEIRALIPKKALAELQRLLGETEEGELISFGRDETHLFFRMKKRLLVCRMLSGSFPNYEAVLPKEHNKTVILDREEMTAAIKRVSLLADEKSRSVRLFLDNNKMEISSSNIDLGEAKEIMDVSYDEGPIQVGFNCQYLLDFLSVTGDASISLDFKDEKSAGQLRPATEEDYHYRYIVMPMRV
jgi:DNA polymerase-3 subunit beta